MAGRLRLSNAERDRLVAAAGRDIAIKSWMSPKEIRRAVHALGNAAFRDRAKLAWAADPRSAASPQWLGLVALGDGWSPPAFPAERRRGHGRRRAQGTTGGRGDARGRGLVDRPGLHLTTGWPPSKS
jgi:hypothetical protein